MSYLRRKYRYPSEVTGTYIEGDSQNGDTSTSTKTFTLGDVDMIEYFVPGDGPCYQVETVCTSVPWSGQVSRTPCYVWWNPHGYTRLHNVYDGLTMSAPSHTLGEIPFSTTELLSRTHPGKPKVSFPNFLAELKDFPAMLRGDGITLLNQRGEKNSFWKRASNTYLSEAFGWKPLLDDLFKMFTFHNSVQKRLKKLNSVFSQKGLTGRLDFGELTEEFHSFDQNMIFGYGDRTSVCKQTVWGTCRWRATDPWPSDPRDQTVLAWQIYYGMHLSPKQLWDMVPWSWMSDWFFNVGDYLQATDNSYGLHAEDIWKHTRLHQHSYDHNVRPHQGMCPEEDSILAGRGEVVFDSYRRQIAPPATISFSVPFLTESQVEIAASLVGSRVRNRPR